MTKKRPQTPNMKLAKQRIEIVNTGRGGGGYKGKRGHSPQHRKGCGFAVLIIGLVMMTAPIMAWWYTA